MSLQPQPFFLFSLSSPGRQAKRHLSPVSSAELSKLISAASCSARPMHWGEVTLSLSTCYRVPCVSSAMELYKCNNFTFLSSLWYDEQHMRHR